MEFQKSSYENYHSLKVNLTSILNFEFELELNNLIKIKNSRGVNRLITESEFKSICILYVEL